MHESETSTHNFSNDTSNKAIYERAPKKNKHLQTFYHSESMCKYKENNELTSFKL